MNIKLFAAAAVGAAALLTGCGSSSPPDQESPVTLTDAGHGLKRVALTGPATQRLGIVTAKVQAVPTGLSIPYQGVIYVSDGSSWTYAQVGPDAFLRAPVTVSSISGNVALLSRGPAAGTPVVVVGAPELLGAEVEISGEE